MKNTLATLCVFQVLFAFPMESDAPPKTRVIYYKHKNNIALEELEKTEDDFVNTSANINLLRENSGQQMQNLDAPLQDIYLDIEKYIKAKDFYLFSITFNDKNNLIASGSSDHLIRLWKHEKDNIKLSNTLHKHTGEVFSVAFSPDGAYLASGANDNTICIWKINTKKNIPCVCTLALNKPIISLAYSPDGNTLEVEHRDSSIKTQINLASLTSRFAE